MNLKISLKHLVYLWAFVAIPSTCQSFLLSPIVASQQNAAGASNLELQTTLTVNSDSDYPISLHWEYNQTRIWHLYIASSNTENRCLLKCGCDRYSVRTSTSTSPAGHSVVTITLTITDLQPDDDNAEVGIVHATTRRLVRLNVGEKQKVVADIVFGLDESGSVNRAEFQHQINWVIELLGSFRNDIDSGDVRIGIVLFNLRARTAIQLNKYNYDALRERISRLRRRRGGSNIGAAIRACKRALDGSTRQGIAKEMIILTDGDSLGDVLSAANNARMSGITTVAVGVGYRVNVNTLLQVAGDPARLFKATDFRNLNQVTAGLTKVIKDSSVMEPKDETKLVADIVLGLDESGSVDATEFQHQLNWVVELLDSFRNDIDSGDVQIGIILFNQNARTAIPLNRYTFDTLKKGISGLSRRSGSTNIEAAIRACKQALDGSTRQGVAKEMIILTDGDSVGNILRAANNARMSGITTVAVGVGSGVNVNTLLQVAGDPARLFKATDFSNLNQVTAGLRKVIKDSSVMEPKTDETKLVADIVLGLDESGSVDATEFQHQLNWVTELLDSFRNDIDSGDVQIGIILFNNNARTAIPLNRYTYDTLKKGISGLSRRRGGTNIEVAIRACKQALDGSTRQGVAKEMIILTDGESSGNVLSAADDARMSGITTVAVGVGSGVNANTLLQVAGDPARLFKATDFSNLNQVTAGLRKVIRDSSVMEPKNEQKVVADIMFGLDESGSVSETDFQHQLNWVVGLLRSFRDLVDSGDVQVGIVLFNSKARYEVQLNRYTYDTLTARISGLRQSQGGTNIEAAIRTCKQALDGSTRQGVAKEMIILTDGDSRGDIPGAANDARTSGIRTTAVGVGSSTKANTLRDIAGSDARVFQVDDFESLEKVSAGVRSLVMESGSGDEEQ